MSAYFRRIIANRILRTLSKHGKLAAAEVDRLGRNVALLVQTQSSKMGTGLKEAQFKLDMKALSKAVGISDANDLTVAVSQISACLRLQNLLQDVQTLLHFGQGDPIEHCKAERYSATISVNPFRFYENILQAVQKEDSSFGSSSVDSCLATGASPQTVLVEYSSPNIAKPFHAGHLRSTIIGNFIANLYEHLGHKVHRINYLGDWGTQFGLLALGFQRYGDVKFLEHDPLLQLLKVYAQINQEVEEEKKINIESTYKEGLQLFNRLEKGDPELVSLWRQFKQLSIEEYDKMYQRLGIKFTAIECESDFSQKTQQLVRSLEENGLLKMDDRGVAYMTVDDRGTEIKATLVKSDGSSLYLSRDVAAALDRHTHFQPDKVHYVVESSQLHHFRQLVGILRQLGLPWANRTVEEIHVQFGRIQGMSSRRGTVVFLRDILDEARDVLLASMKEKHTTRTQEMDKVADILAVSGIIVQDLKGHRQNNYTFSWDRMLSFTGDSGVFLQYAHARLCSLLASCGVEKTPDIDVTCLQEEEVHALLTFIARYPEYVEDTLSRLEPHRIVQYLLKLCHLINGAYATLPVRGEAVDIAQARLLVFDSARQVLANGMCLIGLQPLNEM